MKAGDLVWINYYDPEDSAFSYSGPGRFEHTFGELLACHLGIYGKCLFSASCIRIIATADELKRKQTNKEKS